MAWWHTFPWGIVGSIVAVIGLMVGSLRLAAMFGRAEQRGLDHERRILDIESRVQGVAETIGSEITEQVEARAEVNESAESLARHNLAVCMRQVRTLARQVEALTYRCINKHGEFSRVTVLDDIGEDLPPIEPIKGDGK